MKHYPLKLPALFVPARECVHEHIFFIFLLLPSLEIVSTPLRYSNNFLLQLNICNIKTGIMQKVQYKTVARPVELIKLCLSLNRELASGWRML